MLRVCFVVPPRNDNSFIVFTKGGDLKEEIAESGLTVQQYHLKKYFDEEFFETKQVIYVKA